MNNSGLSVFEFVNFYKISFKDILIIHDDLDLDVGMIKFKCNCSSGGHDGIKSIINCLGSQEFSRLKIGINNEYKKDTIDFVLSKFSKKDIEKLDFDKINNAINDFLSNDINYVMNIYNRK